MWGWQATLASVYYLAGAQIQGLITLTNSGYTPHPWHTVLLFWASTVFTIVMNTIVGKFLPKFEGSILIIHILGFFAILLPLVILGSHQDASEVFGNFLNTGNWPTQGLSFMIGLIGSVYTFTGAWYFQFVSRSRVMPDKMNRCRWGDSCMVLLSPREPERATGKLTEIVDV